LPELFGPTNTTIPPGGTETEVPSLIVNDEIDSRIVTLRILFLGLLCATGWCQTRSALALNNVSIQMFSLQI
jgi:hypothetical protein